MKRSIRISLFLGLSILSILILMTVFAACVQHEHTYGDYQIFPAANCETAGKKVRTCSVCGYEEREEIPAGHVWSEFETVIYAECNTKGERKRSCSVCGYEDIEVIQALGHKWSEFEVTVPAECETAGKLARTCSVCGGEEADIIPALGHKWSEFEVTVPAECETAGKLVRTCSACGGEETDVIPANGHKWSEFEVTVPAECETAGKQARTCSVCGGEETDVIPALGHKWSEFEVTVPAKCETAGKSARTCSVCGGEETDVIPANGHKWTDVEIIIPATCEEDGLKSAVCTDCNATSEEEVIPALGHVKASGFPLTAPTCEKTGQNQNKCAVCGKSYREIVPALGHSYSDEFTVDNKPTIDEEGEQSRHCINDGCTSRTDVQSIPRLISEAYFRINIVRGENQTLLPTTYNPMIKIVDEQGKTVTTSFVFGNENKEHIFEKLLPFGTYTVSIANQLPAGFECGVYTISEKDGTYPYDTPDKYPTITMHLYSHLGEGTMTNGDKKNTVLNDFTVTTIDGVRVSISQLLTQKKLVWLNFYYNDCYPCRSEAPEIIRIAQQFDVAVICFNGKDSLDEIRSGAKSIFKFPDSFYIVQDSGDVYGKLFGRYAYPLNVFIDSGGCVFESVTGSNYSSQFYNFVKNNLFTTPEKEDTPSVAFVELAAILLDKQRYTYKSRLQDEG